jgi:Cupredoxin-like domain
VTVADFEFQPVEQSVQPGAEVTWRNTGQARHTATFDDVPLETEEIAPGSAGTLTAPADPGSYSYFCAIHPGQMRAVLVVVDQGIVDPTVEVEAPPPEEAAAPPPTPPPPESAGTPLIAFALITVGIGAFLGGFGLSGFLRRSNPAT